MVRSCYNKLLYISINEENCSMWSIKSERHPKASSETFSITYSASQLDELIADVEISFHQERQCRVEIRFFGKLGDKFFINLSSLSQNLKSDLIISPSNKARLGWMKDEITTRPEQKTISARLHEKRDIEKLIDFIHQIMPFQDVLLDDVMHTTGYNNTPNYEQEIKQYLDNRQSDEALLLAKQMLTLRAETYTTDEESIVIAIAEYCQEINDMDSALALYQMVPQEKKSHLVFAQAYLDAVDSCMESDDRQGVGEHINEAFGHALSAFENICNNNYSKQSLKLLFTVIEKMLFLKSIQLLELKEDRQLELREMRFPLLLKLHDYTNESQTKIDRAYDELCGNNGFSPAVTSVQGQPEILLSIARQIRQLKEENKDLRARLESADYSADISLAQHSHRMF